MLKKCQFASLKIPILSVIFNPDGKQRIDVRLDGETVWITQMAMSELFVTIKQNISLYLKNIFSEGELEEEAVVKEYLTTTADGKNYRTKMYNLKTIISVGYRVRSHRGVMKINNSFPSRRDVIICFLRCTYSS